MRPALHRKVNDEYARAYGAVLRSYLHDIAADPAPLATVLHHVGRMQEVAEATLPTAFLRGKQQAVGGLATYHTDDQLWVERKLNRNLHYLHTSLAPAIHDKLFLAGLHRPGLVEERKRALDESFGARLQNLYGGIVWTVAEAGFRSGAVDLARILHGIQRPLLVQEDGEDDEEYVDPTTGQKKKRKDWLVLIAGKLSMDVDTFIVEYASLQIGIRYMTEHDLKVCGPCDGAAGDYYAPDQAPLPGEVCDGGPNCRCWLELITNSIASAA